MACHAGIPMIFQRFWRDLDICYIPAGKPVTFPDLDRSCKCHRFPDPPTELGKTVTFSASSPAPPCGNLATSCCQIEAFGVSPVSTLLS